MGRCVSALMCVIVLSFASSALAVTGGQTDDFENGTLLGWNTGSTGTPPTNVTTGGPAGSNDNFLSLDATGGSGANSKWVIINSTQWTGNYTSAGITSIAMDLKLISGSPPLMRVALKSGSGQSAGYVSTTGFTPIADNNWHHAVFNVSSSSMTAVNGPSSFSTFLASIGEMRLLSSASPAVIGDTIVATVGVDNITAIVPEPTGLTLLGIAGLARCCARQRRADGR